MSSNESQEKLVSRLLAGRSSAVRDIYELYFDRICKVLANKLDHRLIGRQGVSDLAQSALVAFFGRADDLLRDESDEAVLWRLICGIALNKLRERRRQAFRRKRDARREFIQDEDNCDLSWLESSTPTPDELIELAESIEGVSTRLNDFDRSVFTRLISGIKIVDIAAEMGCTYWKVNRAVHRIRSVTTQVFLAADGGSQKISAKSSRK